MATGFEAVDEVYIIELKDESENENTRKAWTTGRMFSKSGQKIPSKFRRVRDR